MKKIIALFILLTTQAFPQEKIETIVDMQAQPIGGKQDVEYIFQSQLIYPADLLKKNISEEVVVYFNVLSNSIISNIEFKKPYQEEFKKEVVRLLRYINFYPAKIGNVNVASQTFLSFKFNPDTYKKYTKKRGFIIPSELALFDTSFVVYEKADTYPEYHKGNEALEEYILSSLEYPDLAVRQNIQGTVLLNFIVEPNGTLSNLHAYKEFNTLCTQEAFRIMRDTKWKPGKKDGKLVRYKTKYPIIFNLNNQNKDNATSEQR